MVNKQHSTYITKEKHVKFTHSLCNQDMRAHKIVHVAYIHAHRREREYLNFEIEDYMRY